MVAPAPSPPPLRTKQWGVWVLVAIPTMFILVCGILILAFQKSLFDVTMGLLLLAFCVAIGVGAGMTIVGLRSDRQLAALQLDFVSKVSHELKTPLTSIRLFAETLRLGRVKDPGQVDRCLEIIQKETERLSILIGRLLSFGAMESGVFRVEPQRMSVRDLVQRVTESFEPQRIQHQVDLVVEVEPELPEIEVDPVVTVDAILNLLNNAVKYGGTSKRVEFSVRRRPEGAIGIEVKDHGIGIAPHHQRRIFDRFYRADERYSRAVEGVGLGLAIARHIVIAHGGTIEVRSKPGEGSAFTIVLPAREARGDTNA